jgi:hypothetical protein
LGFEVENIDWFVTVVKSMGEAKGLQYFRDLASSNGISVRKGHTNLTNMVAAGEVPMALTVYNYMPEQLKKKGAPIDWLVLQPAVVRGNAVGVMKNAKTQPQLPCSWIICWVKVSKLMPTWPTCLPTLKLLLRCAITRCWWLILKKVWMAATNGASFTMRSSFAAQNHECLASHCGWRSANVQVGHSQHGAHYLGPFAHALVPRHVFHVVATHWQ